jgi:hypothetical protein
MKLESALQKLSKMVTSLFFPVDYVVALLEQRVDAVEK